MKLSLSFAVISIAAMAGFAGPVSAQRSQHMTVQCLDMDGYPRRPVCRQSDIWRQPDICSCPANTLEVEAPYCDRGEVPAVISHDSNRARMAAARHGTLVGATYEGRRFCVRPVPTPH
jgi:hypothetical protein